MYFPHSFPDTNSSIFVGTHQAVGSVPFIGLNSRETERSIAATKMQENYGTQDESKQVYVLYYTQLKHSSLARESGINMEIWPALAYSNFWSSFFNS